MSNTYPRQPVSDEVCQRILDRLLNSSLLGKGGMLDVRKGARANELIMVTVEGEIPCRVMEDDLFIIFEMPSGQNDLCAPKREFLEALSGDEPAESRPSDGEMPTGG